MDLARVERGQLVLVAAAVVAIGLAPMLFAYLQLGYHPDVDKTGPPPTGENAVGYLDRSVHDVAAGTAGEYEWDEREAMATDVREQLTELIETLEASRIEEGISYEVAYADGTAETWHAQASACNSGDGKRFGPCIADGGVVLGERAGEAVLLAVAFEVRIVSQEGISESVVVVEFGG